MQVIGEIGERIAEGRELPVEHREHAGLSAQDHVVEPVVAMHEPHRPAGGRCARQPFDQALHLVDLLGLGGAVLLRPALDLARHVVLAAAVVGEPDRGRIEGMQPRQRRVHGVVDGGALGRVGAGMSGSQITRPSTCPSRRRPCR